ncbi:hypothetical protein BN946_scf184783.g14 [Trametes cinnabarina]|uniref:Uncharacterized protein n=1 Tax=Pycnoporus cinnabarinus TaxID=5643 RepID=A0A060S6Y1_PYCCI|nr:hypothetical protein BN946_scf184783.g14 [Trametes cinnabarina]
MVSLHNPFRDRSPDSAPPPEALGSAPSVVAASDASEALSSSSAEPSQRLPESSSPEARTVTPTGHSTMSSEDRSVNDLLTEELPPPYTPAPNVYEGEATLELGPRRPFQQTPQLPPQSYPHHRPPWVSPEPPASWSSFSGGLHRESPNTYTRPAPPPVHPSLQNGGPPQLPPRPLSDFARDFYTAGADVQSGALGGPSSQYQGEAPTASSSWTARYAPPSGEPSHRSAKGAPTSSVDQTANPADDDGRPTEVPVPGHPLLKDGKILVYPRDYECSKCHNTGYKGYDPSHPCSRCWDKYAKPYSGVLAHAPWSSEAQSESSSSRTSLQRPLPRFRTPQEGLHQQGASYSGQPLLSPYSILSPSASTSRVASGYPGAAARVIPIAGGGIPMSPYLDPLQSRGPSGIPPHRPGLGRCRPGRLSSPYRDLRRLPETSWCIRREIPGSVGDCAGAVAGAA